MAKPSPRFTNRYLMMLAAGVIILVVAGFGGRRFFLKKSPESVSTAGGEVAIKNEDGESVYSQKSLPKDFPADFPIYPGAKLTGSWSTQGEAGSGMSILWETPAGVSEVATFYKDSLAKKGWEVSSSFAKEDSFVISFTKDKLSGFVGVSANGQTTISVTLGW